ncbi:MAG: RecX family transcriptional regulator [Chloroflexi bacterium]|nr:RecX family transcriptional regulator [Chloroflexota bacterium]
MIVTNIERKRGRVRVFIDGEQALELSPNLAAERGIRPGRTVTSEELAELADEDARRRAMDTAFRLLAYGPRSVHELRNRLKRKSFEPEIIARTVDRLKELGYVDDEAFARFWTESRRSSSPRSARLLASELRLKGIAPQVANEATSAIADDEAAYEAASGRLRSLRGLQYKTFRERLGRFLTSRGFDYGVARETIDRCWEELGGTPDGTPVD